MYLEFPSQVTHHSPNMESAVICAMHYAAVRHLPPRPYPVVCLKWWIHHSEYRKVDAGTSGLCVY